MTALMDTGFLLALLNDDDHLHTKCRKTFALEPKPLLPMVVLPELAYMVIRNTGYAPFIAFVRSALNNDPPLVATVEADLSRAMSLMERYGSSRIDFVDCVIVAMAERLNIGRILTVDQRDFRMIRPNHIVAFEILP